MAKPTFEVFQASARKALLRADGSADLLVQKGPSFHFYDDGLVDSLDMLDIAFYIDQDIKVKIDLESLIHGEVDMTLQNLYDSIRTVHQPPA